MLGLDPEEFCFGTDEPEADAPVLTPGRIAEAFYELPLPAAELVVEPPNGRTLVNFETNFYTERGPLERTVALLGRQVQLRITPSAFTWRFGDGSQRTTSEPGAPYPRLDVTHAYASAERVYPSVDTTYTAEFRVGNGAWQPVPGSSTIAGEPAALAVVEATPRLVG